MARRNSRPPKKYTSSGRLSSAYTRFKEKALAQRAKESAKAAKQRAERSEKQEFVKRAKRLAKIVPSLRDITSEKKITPSAKRRIRYREKQLKEYYNLRPVSKSFTGKTVAPGVRAVSMTGVPERYKIQTVRGKNLRATDQYGREWLFLAFDSVNWGRKSETIKAAQDALEYPIQRLAKFAGRAIEKYKPIAISLWLPTGRQSETFPSLERFQRFVDMHWQSGKYHSSPDYYGRTHVSNPNDFIRGIALLIKE